MAQAAQDHWRECTCLTNLVMLALETDNPAQALEYGNELIQVAAQMGGGSEAAHAAALDALAHYLLPEQQCSEALAQACQVLRQIDSPRMLAYVQTLAAESDLHQGKVQQAVARAETALAAAQIVNNPSEVALAWTLIIQASHQRGNRECAHKHFAELQRRVADHPLSNRAQRGLITVQQLLSE
jgi:hypothetical protein